MELLLPVWTGGGPAPSSQEAWPAEEKEAELLYDVPDALFSSAD